MSATVHDLRPHFTSRQPQPVAVQKIQRLDEVSWRNPNTGEHWGELRVEFVYRLQGYALVRGCFGRISVRTGSFVVESRSVALADLTVTKSAGAVQ